MLQKVLSHLFGQILYIQIWEHRLRVLNPNSGDIFDEPALVGADSNHPDRTTALAIGQAAVELEQGSAVNLIAPFSHPRTLLNDFSVAEILLRKVFKELCGTQATLLRPRVIIHPMEKLEGGLTKIERRAFIELALAAGAMQVCLHTGEPLSNDPAQMKALLKQQTSNN